MEAFELASLLCSRLCHDLVSPVGAVTNGLEVLADEDDPEMRAMAFRLIEESANRAATKLQFARLAYGAAGGPGSLIDMGEARKVTDSLLGDHKVSLNWQCEMATADRLLAKLLTNVAFLCAESLPRGGEVTAAISELDGQTVVDVTATGEMVRPAEDLQAILSGNVKLEELQPRAAQAYYTGMVARCLDSSIEAMQEPDKFTVRTIVSA